MKNQTRNEFHYDTTDKVYLRQDNSNVIILECFFSRLEKENSPVYRIYHEDSGKEMHAQQSQLTTNPEPSHESTDFRIGDILYCSLGKVKVVSIQEEEPFKLKISCETEGEMAILKPNELSFYADKFVAKYRRW